MYLKRIEIKGFKSFADKIDIELNKGITGIIGPNGSGKSNISDAVKWVLGEQSAKNLRGMKMEDVIFAGTSTRKPLGFAEVSITVDNSDGLIPVEYTEITATRRMYRSGDSEYFINGTSCRLKDISDVFMDTGIGRDGYSIIGQGRIDEIINARADERREIFEEAAGIVKYKVRKQEAERKLESTEQNINRIRDIINELENQIEPLKVQSHKAKEYLNLKESLKTLELNIFIRNADRLKDKINSTAVQSSHIEDELLENNRNNARLEGDYTDIRLHMEENRKNIESLQNQIYSFGNEIEKLSGQADVLNEKLKNSGKNISRIDSEIESLNTDIDNMNIQLDEVSKKKSAIESDLQKERDLLLNKNSEFEKISSSINEKEEKTESIKTEIIEILNRLSDVKGSINSLTALKDNIKKRKSQILTEKSKKLSIKNETENSLKAINNEVKLHTLEINKLNDEIILLDKERSDILNKRKIIDKNIYELNSRIQSCRAKYNVLKSMENEFEGYSKSVKEIMRLKSHDKSLNAGICGTVAELVDVPKEYEIAIEVSIGASLQNIVTENEYIAKHCIEFLKKNKFGRATFLPLTTVQARKRYSNSENIRRSAGFIGFADELIRYKDRYKNIFSSLLGRVIIMDNIDKGITLAKRINYSTKIVTLEGDIISAGGAFTGGSTRSKTGGILSRKREIDELKKDLKELEDSLVILNSQREYLDKKQQSNEKSIEEKESAKHSESILLSTASGKIKLQNAELERNKQDYNDLYIELSQNEGESKEIESKITEEKLKYQELDDRSRSLSEKARAEQAHIKDISSAREKIISENTSIKIRIAQLEQTLSSFNEKRDEIKNKIDKCESSASAKRNEKEEEIKQIENIKSEIEKTGKTIEDLTKRKSQDNKKLESLNNDKQKNALILQELEKKKKEYDELSKTLQSEIHKIEMQKAKYEMELENAQNKIWDEYELSYASAMEYKTEMADYAGSLKDAQALRERIKGLGEVNVGAIDEYIKIKERYEFLKKQEEDLMEAKEALNVLISEMTEKMKTQFVSNLKIINENFNTTFKSLFGGGRAEIVLSDKDEILSSGVDIIAEPPGKKLQSLSLLSGGEKALTAIALLFAILKMKPSPFCILDEIEAALDDANVARYAEFLREYSKNTQFIIVTHRKGTMEISDMLYGVTMEEKGVSKLISIKLPEMAG
ncbi:MAG TPA: chromosome segregation protein SMC [Clostridiaceae bacterium]|nr:chromosome segregation protein SMC [Clostridiaceae bacterium]